MGVIDYKVKLSIDDAKALASIKNIKTQKEELENGQVILDFKYNADIKGFNKEFSKLIKTNPNLDIQFQYDINQKMLDAEKKKIQDTTDIKLAISTGKEMDYIKPMLKEIEELYNSVGINDDALIAPFKKLKDVLETITSNGGTIKFRDNIFETFDMINAESDKLGKYKGISLIDEKAEERAKELEQVLTKLVELGASSDKKTSGSGVVGISKKDLDDVKKQLEDVKEQIDNINDELSSKTDKSFKDFSTNAKILREELDKVVLNLDSYKQKIEDVQNLPGDVFDNLTNSAKNLREELEKIVNTLGENKNNVIDVANSLNADKSSSESVDKVVQKIDELKGDLVNGLKINNVEDLASAFTSVNEQLSSLTEKMDLFLTQIQNVKSEDLAKIAPAQSKEDNTTKPFVKKDIVKDNNTNKNIHNSYDYNTIQKGDSKEIQDYKTDINNLESELNTIEKNIKILNARLQKAESKTEIADIKSRINKQENSKRIIENRIQSTKVNIDDVRGQKKEANTSQKAVIINKYNTLSEAFSALGSSNNAQSKLDFYDFYFKKLKDVGLKKASNSIALNKDEYINFFKSEGLDDLFGDIKQVYTFFNNKISEFKETLSNSMSVDDSNPSEVQASLENLDNEVSKVDEQVSTKVENTAQEIQKNVSEQPQKTDTDLKTQLSQARAKLVEAQNKMLSADTTAESVKKQYEELTDIIDWYNEAVENIAKADGDSDKFNDNTIKKQLTKGTNKGRVKASVYNHALHGEGTNKQLDDVYSAVLTDVNDTEKLELLKKQQAEADKLAREAKDEYEQQKAITEELENQISLLGQKENSTQSQPTAPKKNNPIQNKNKADYFGDKISQYQADGRDKSQLTSYVQNLFNFYTALKKQLSVSDNVDYFDKYESILKSVDSKYTKYKSKNGLNNYLDKQIQKASLVLEDAQKVSAEAVAKSNEAVENSAKVVDKVANVSEEVSSAVKEEVENESSNGKTEGASDSNEVVNIKNATEAIDLKTKAVEKEQTTVNASVSQEINDFQRLANFIKDDVIKAVNNKTESFEDEGSRVDKVVSGEIEKLELLVKELEKIKENSDIDLEFKHKHIKINNGQSSLRNFDSEKLLGIIDSIRPILEVLAQNVANLSDCVVKFGSVVSTMDFSNVAENAVGQNWSQNGSKASSNGNAKNSNQNNKTNTKDDFNKLKGNIASTIKQAYRLLNTASSQGVLSGNALSDYEDNIKGLTKIFNEFTDKENPFDFSAASSKFIISKAQNLLDILKQQNQEFSVFNASQEQAFKESEKQKNSEQKLQKERNKALKKEALNRAKDTENTQKANELQDIATAYKYLKNTYEEYLRISAKEPEDRTEYENSLLQKRLEYLKLVQKEEAKYYANDESNRSYKSEDYHYYQNSVNEKIAKKQQEQAFKESEKQKNKNNAEKDAENKKAEAEAIKEVADAYKYLKKTYSDWLKIKDKNADDLSDYEKTVKQRREDAEDIIAKSEYDNPTLDADYKEYTQKEDDKWNSKQSKEEENSLTTLKNLQDKLNAAKEKANKLSAESSKRYTKSAKEQIAKFAENNFNNLDTITSDNVNKVKSALNKFKSLLDSLSGDEYKQGSATKLSNLVGDLSELQRYTNVPKELENKVTSLLKVVESAYSDSENVNKIDLNNLISSTVSLKNQVEAVGSKSLSFFDQMKQRLQDMNSKYIAQFFSFQDWIRYGREVINIITEIDSAMTELRKVSNATETELNQALTQATTTAKELGANISDIVSLQADWSRLGYSVEEAEELARVTQLYVNVGDNLTTDTASEYMISTLQGFNIEAENAIEIVDKFNEVANNFAIDTEGLGDALERSAASFTASGTDLSEAIAIVTTANTVVQDSEKVGTAMKTLSARIRGASTELEDLGEEEDAYTKSTSKLRKEVLALTGFDIMEDETTYKSIYEILLGIGQEWDNLTDVEQASLGEALAGKQNSNVFYSIMQNIDDLQDVYETAENAAGSAEKEELSYEKSIEYSLDRIKASAQEWANDLISSDVIKWFVDLANAIVNVSTKFTALGTVIVGAGIFAGVKNFKSLKTSMESYSSVLQMLSANGLDSKKVTNLGGLSADSVTSLANSLKGLNEQQANLVLSTTSLDAESKNYLLTCAGIKAANIEQIAQNGTLTESILTNNLARVTATKEEAASLVTKMQEAGVIEILENGTVRLTKATLQEAIAESALSKVDKERITNAFLQQTANKGLTASYSKLAKAQLEAMFANPATWIMLAAGAITVITKIVDYFSLSIEEATENSNNFLESAKSLNSEISNNSSSISELNDRYQELSKGVSSTGENMSLTTSEYEEYKDLVSQISELLPNLNTFFDEQGNKIGFVAGHLSDLNEEYTKYAQQKTWEELNTKDEEGNTISESNAKTYDDYVNGSTKDKLLKALQNSKRDDILSKVTDNDETMLNMMTYNLAQVTDYTRTELRDIFYESGADAIYGILDEAVSTLEKEGESAFAPLREEISDWIFVDENYDKLSDETKKSLSDFVSSLDAELYGKVNSKGLSAEEFAKKLIDQFSDEDLQQAWTDLTNLDLSDVQFGDIDSTLQEKAKTVFETLGLEWDNGGYELLVALNLVPDETNYNALKDMLGENGDLADGLTVGQIDTLTSDDFQEWAKDAEVNISEVAESYRDELTDAAQEVLDEERQKAKDWSEEVPGLYEKVYDEQGNYILKQSQFGNVDMDKREIITWTRELKKQYADALASWDYDPEIGSIDTVFGGWDEFGDENLPISFTPILVDKNGENAQFLDSNTVYDYINNLVEQSTKNGKIDTDLLLQLDADRENGGWGLISGVGDEAEMISMLTHFAGLFGAEQIAMEDMQEAASDDGWAKKLVNAYKIAQKGTEKLSDSLSDITTKMDGLSSLGDIYEDVQDGGEFDYSSIADTSGDFYTAFGNLGQPYEDFLQTVADSPSNISKCQQAFNNLATTWVYANGVLDDLDNTNKQATANMLKQNGIQNATEMVNAYISAANTYTQAYNSLDGATDKAISLADATWEDIETMAQVPEVTQEAADAMYIYYIQKLMASSGFTSASDIQELANVIQALGIAGTAWGKYYSARANYQALSNVDLSDGESKTVSLVNLKTGKAYEKEIKSQKQLNHYLEYQNNIMNSNKSEGLDQMAQKVGNLGAKVKKTADDTSSDAKDKADEIEDAYENLLDAETTVLEKQLDAQLITYSDYLDKRLALLEDYHNKGLISEEKYYEGLADTYQSEIDNYDKVISAVDKVIDDKVKALEKQKDALEDANDAQVKALEKQQKALENRKKLLEDQQDDIDKQKEALEDQKEALEDANQAREDAIELQKALYDLEKAQTQRTRLIYNNGQMVYRSDASSIRDAQDNLDDITYEKKVDAIEDAIDALDDQIDALDDEIDALDDEIDKLDDEIDELNDALDLQTDAIDKQIDALNDYKDKWDEIANAWQDAQNIAMANQILGDNWQNQVLALDTTPIENFKNTYVDAQNQMALANEMAAEAAVTAAQKELAAAQSSSSGTQNAVAGATNSLTGFTDSLVGDGGSSSGGKAIGWSSTGYIGTTLDGKKLTGNPFSDYKTLHSGNNNSGTKQFGTSTSVTGASSEASDAVDDMNNSISNTSSVVPGVQSSLSALTSSLNNEVGGYAKSTSAIKANTEARLGNLAAMQKEAEADALRQKINSRGYSITTPTTSGIACATGSSGLKSTQQALTSEYGQAEMIVTPDGHWQVTTEPTLQNLPKGTVIYDGDQTEQLLKGNAYSTGTGATITPLAEADSEKFKMFSDVSAMLVNTNSINVGLKDISKSLAQISAEVTPRTQSNDNGTQQVTFGNITVNCPGVTEAEVAKNLPNALQNAFSGLALNAYQQSMKR